MSKVVSTIARTPAPRVGGDPPGGGDPVQHRHPDVHQQHVRTLPPGQRDRLLPGRCLTGDLNVIGHAQLDLEPVTDQCLIIAIATRTLISHPARRRGCGPGPASRIITRPPH